MAKLNKAGDKKCVKCGAPASKRKLNRAGYCKSCAPKK